jgi:hypothetical protein
MLDLDRLAQFDAALCGRAIPVPAPRRDLRPTHEAPDQVPGEVIRTPEAVSA